MHVAAGMAVDSEGPILIVQVQRPAENRGHLKAYTYYFGTCMSSGAKCKQAG